MRRIALLVLTMGVLLTVCSGCGWKIGYEWCERKQPPQVLGDQRRR